MAAPNPFIELWRNPVVTLVALGYVLLLLSLVVATAGICWRNAVTLHVRFHSQRPRQWEYVPPLSYLLRLVAIPLILWIDSWAIAATIWMLS